MLKNLEGEGLIQIKKIEERGKNIFQITNEGKKVLKSLIKHKDQMEEKFIQFRRLIAEIIGEKEMDIMNVLFNIRKISMGLPTKQRNEVVKTLEKYLSGLKKIDSQQI